jgi:two-component system nitrogen regulation response regulator NtrX
MEDVLFGRENGTNAGQGLLEQANGGVIYFDEIADMPLITQSKILRFLVDQKFQRVGGSENVKVDLRVLSSTSRDLLAEIQAERFREELYHRLNVVPVTVPSLAERRDDIPMFVDHFVDHFHKTQGFVARKFQDDALALLQTMAWPGNVRQLKNVVERILILTEGSRDITAEDIPSDRQGSTDDTTGTLSSAWAAMPLREAREEFEREYLLTQINRFGGNISKTAHFVGMERSALHRKLKSLGIVSGHKQAGDDQDD